MLFFFFLEIAFHFVYYYTLLYIFSHLHEPTVNFPSVMKGSRSRKYMFCHQNRHNQSRQLAGSFIDLDFMNPAEGQVL